MAAVSTSPVSVLQSSGSSMAAEAQRLMALSVNKIVASRSRRGGISLHRNLLVAGVLFRARDALLAAGKMSSPSPSSGSSSAPEDQRQQPDQVAEDSSRNPASSPSASAMPQSQSESTASETGTYQQDQEPARDDDDSMDVEIVGKENVPPPVATQPTATPEFSKPAAETEDAKACDDGAKQHGVVAAARKRRCSESVTSCPIAVKSAKTCSSTSSSAAASADSRTRSSSVPACNSRVLSKRVAGVSAKSGGGTAAVAVSPVVYLNRVDVAFCSTPAIGGGIMGSVRPVLVVQVV